MGHFQLALCIQTSTGDDSLCIGRESIRRGIARIALIVFILYGNILCIDIIDLISVHTDLMKECPPPLCVRMNEVTDDVGNRRDGMLFRWVNLRHCTIVQVSIKLLLHQDH